MKRIRSFGAALAFVVVAAGCGDSPTAPEAFVPEANATLLSVFKTSSSVTVVERATPLANDEVVSLVIGRNGGTIYLPQSGFTVVVPRGAVKNDVLFTVTAPAGNLVGYEFAPHGLKFKEPLRAYQDMSKTKLGLVQSLFMGTPIAAYFEGALAPQIVSSELLNLDILGLLGLATFQIEHFSGYVIATD